MRTFVTGGTGFIGRQLVRKLRDRGDEVVALVRTPAKAEDLRALGCELVEGDLSDEQAIRRGVQGAEAVFHVGATYKVGIPASQRAAMHDANVGGTERVLDAVVAAGAQRIVYVSTGNVYGNTRGEVVDESYVRPQPPDFLSYFSYFPTTTRRNTRLIRWRLIASPRERRSSSSSQAVSTDLTTPPSWRT